MSNLENDGSEKSEEKKSEDSTSEQKQLYAYLDRDNFTTEKFKIEVRGLPKYYGISEFKKFLNDKLELNASKIKPPRKGGNWAYICFRSEEFRNNAISVLNGIEWKKSKLTAHAANPAPDPFIKRKFETKEESRKKMKCNPDAVDLPPDKRIQLITIPLFEKSYPEQLKLKQKNIEDFMKNLGNEMLKVNKDLEGWFNKQKIKNNGLPCELEEIVHSNVTDGYRNKCEFTIGLDITGTKKMIGFRLSRYADGSIAVGPVDHLVHIPQKMKTAVKILEQFVCDSDLDTFNPVTHAGYWKQVTVRQTTLDHLMLIIGIHPQSMSDEDLKMLQNKLKDFFEHEKGAGVTSLFFQTIKNKSAGGEGGGQIVHLSGTPYIEEKLLGLTFRISPEAFFQINTLAAEALYSKAIELAQPFDDSTLLDVYCGTGTIGLTFAKHCDEVLGIEMIANAIKDAKINAQTNNMTNCEFFVGKAEDILIPVLKRTTKSNIIAVVDPPRAGLHQKAVVALRRADKLNKLVFIACDAKAAMKNFLDLVRPNSKQYYNDPFVPVKAVPVDMFPHTNHCELIVYFERHSATKEVENQEL